MGVGAVVSGGAPSWCESQKRGRGPKTSVSREEVIHG